MRIKSIIKADEVKPVGFSLVFINYTLLFLDYVEVLEVEMPLVALFEGSLREGAGAARRLRESACGFAR